MPDGLFYERYGMSPDTVAILTQMGYTLKGHALGRPLSG